jgi:hypothetical protein
MPYIRQVFFKLTRKWRPFNLAKRKTVMKTTTPIRSLRGWQLPAFLGLMLSTSLVMGVQPQSTPAQFDITAPIEKFTLDTCAPPPSALHAQSSYAAVATGNVLTCTATIVLNGQSITLPANTVITYPATFLTPYESFAYNPLCASTDATPCQNETGLAIQDTKRLPDILKPAHYEASIKGNVIYDAAGAPQRIAGLVSITQEDLNNGEGFINFIDYATGEIRVGGDIGVANGARIKINDPFGRFGRVTGPYGDSGPDTQDVRFAVDDGNPTITAETGYPLCIPRTAPVIDPLCPETNRPIGGPILNGVQMHLGTFYMPTAPAPTQADPNARVPDPGIGRPANFPAFLANLGNPMQQAPLEVGDYIVYAGTQAVDNNGPNGTKSTYVSAHTITANLGIYTTPGTDPAYVTQEVSIVGVGVTNGFAGPAEGRELFKIVGFTTDVARPIDTGMVQVDPCDGTEGFRNITTQFPNGSALDPTGQALANVPLGRFRSTFLKGTALATPMRPAAKEIRAQIQGSLYPVVANGLTSGQYQAPVSEYIFAENLGFGGLPIVPNNLEDFPFLALGHGPWDLFDPYLGTSQNVKAVHQMGNSPIQGQLNPWPGAPIPAAVSCAFGADGKPLSAPPIIVAPDQLVVSQAAVSLNATASTPGTVTTPAHTLSFSWTQNGLPNVMPVGVPVAGTSTLNFTAPTVNLGAAPVVLSFNLTVTDDVTARVSNKTVSVTVNPAASVDTLQIPTVPTYRTKDGSWGLAVNCIANCNTSGVVTFVAKNSAGTIVQTSTGMTHTNGTTTWTYNGRNVITPAPTIGNLTVTATSSKGGSISAAVAVRIN